MMYSRVLVVIVLVVMIAGCGKKEKPAKATDDVASEIVSRAVSMASGQKTEVKVDGETVKITGTDGTVTVHAGKNGKLPEDFPTDLPRYKGAEILQSASQGKEAFAMSMQTEDALAKVAAFYKKEMASQGWESETAMDMPNRSILAFKKGNRAVNVMLMKNKEGGTVISLGGGTDD